MRRRQDRSILHVCLQIPELLEADSADVYDVVALRDWRFGVAASHSGVTYLVSDSYRANSRRFFVSTLGRVVFDFARFFSYAEMFFEFSGATSKRKSGMPRLSRRPSHWGYYEAVRTHTGRATT
jgi:hypothetical protein